MLDFCNVKFHHLQLKTIIIMLIRNSIKTTASKNSFFLFYHSYMYQVSVYLKTEVSCFIFYLYNVPCLFASLHFFSRKRYYKLQSTYSQKVWFCCQLYLLHCNTCSWLYRPWTFFTKQFNRMRLFNIKILSDSSVEKSVCGLVPVISRGQCTIMACVN